MPLRISSRSNPRVRALRSALTTGKDGTIGIEGFHLLREAVASGLQFETLFLRDDRADVLHDLPEDAAREVLLLSHDAFEAASSTGHAQGVAATLPRPPALYAPRTGDLLLVADAVQDPGNLGTLIRSAEAFGAAAVALTSGTVDPWNGKCLRAAAGAAFRLPLPRWDDALLASLAALSADVYAAVPREGTFAYAADLRGTVVLIVGNEGAGVSAPLLAQSTGRITLPTTGPTESLNAAVAGSLLLYEASLQRGGVRA